MTEIINKIRLYVAAERLSKGLIIPINARQTHYLHHVMRLHEGSLLKIFNGLDGEWQASVVSLNKNKSDLKILAEIRPQTNTPELHLYFAPLKQDPLRFLIEKATELGVTHLHPILTDHTVVRGFNREKAHLIAIEAAEQCERLDIPHITDPKNLKAVLSGLRDALYIGDERRQAEPLLQKLQNHPTNSAYAVLIGPEGGFSEGEFAYFEQLSFMRFVSLAPYVLRAETASITALAQIVGYRQT